MAGDPTPDGETYADVAARLACDPTALAEWLKEAPEGVAYDFARRLLAEAKLKQAEAELDHWKREHEELAAKWAILAERTLVASVLVAEDAPADVEAELAPIRLDVLRKVLAGEAGRDDLAAALLPKLAEAERRYVARAEDERGKAVRLLRTAMAIRMYGERAPGGDETWAVWDRRAEWFLRTADHPTDTTGETSA